MSLSWCGGEGALNFVSTTVKINKLTCLLKWTTMESVDMQPNGNEAS